MTVVVVGAGLSGIACARELRAAGLDVQVYDRGHRPGGRMASRRLWDRPTDLGASYLTVDDPDFRAVVDDWHERGLARPWTDTFLALGGADGPQVKTGPMRWGAAGGLRSLVEDLAAGLDVVRRDVTAVAELDADAVVLALPDPQARRLLAPGDPLIDRLSRTFEPALALAARWPERTWDGTSPTGRFDGAFVAGDPTLAWVADDGRRRGDDAPVLVAHSTPRLAAAHLDDPDAAVPALIRALCDLLDLPEPTDTHVHRWSFAKATGERDEPFALVDGRDGPVGVCGDGWGATSKVETAWRSGRDLARALADRLRSPATGR